MIAEFTTLNNLLIFGFFGVSLLWHLVFFINLRIQPTSLRQVVQHNPITQPKSFIYWLVLFFGLGFPVHFVLAQGPFSTLEDKSLQHVDLKGVPSVIHFNRNDFNADPQFWAMCEDAEGILYFCNNDGALVYDGESWQKVTLPNGSSVRSLLNSKDG